MSTVTEPGSTTLAPPRYATPLAGVTSCVVDATDGDVGVRARVDVGADPDALAGHFPAAPVLPGVHLLEAALQALRLGLAARTGPVSIRVVESLRLRAPALPGHALDVRLRAVARPETADAAPSTPDGSTTGAAGPEWSVTGTVSRGDGTRVADLRLAVGGAPAGIGARCPSTTPERPCVGDGSDPPGGAALGHRELRRLLPHGHPALVLDRVLTLDPGRGLVAEKAVTCTEPSYRFVGRDAGPGADDYPAGMLVESVGQAAAAGWLASGDDLGEDVLMLAVVRGFAVHGAVRPGDIVRHHVGLGHGAAGSALATAHSCVRGRLVATVDDLLAVRRPGTVLTRVPTS